MENETIPPGWYDDGHGSTRWWDGTRWTEQVAATGSAPPAGPGPAVPESSPAPEPQPPMDAPPSPTAASTVYGPQHQPTSTAPLAPPRKRRLGLILAVGVVVVVAGIVAGAALVIPAAMNANPVGEPSAAAPTPSPAADADAEPTTAELSEADRAAAVAAVQSYQDAWLEADCDAYFTSTTVEWQEFQELTDCESFYASARAWGGGIEDWSMEILEVEQIGESVAVSLSETYTSEWDAEGNPLEAPTAFDDRWEYLVIEEDGVWLIDDGFLE